MTSSPAEAALGVARKRHAAIAAGDVEAYMADEAAFGIACGVLTADGAVVPLSVADIPALDELIALETQSLKALEGLMREASARLDVLRKAGLTNGAYLRHERSL